MPAIKAYKFRDSIVPTEDATIITAYRCPWTDKVIESKPSYIKHLRAIRRDRIHAKIINDRMERTMAEFNSQPDWDSMIQWVERNSRWFLARVRKDRGHHRSDRWPNSDDFRIKITYLNIRRMASVSNSHYCPRGGVTNWGRDPGKPTGYPGWSGRIEFEISHQLPGFGSDILRGTGINTGSGGGHGRNYGFEVFLFDADWPAITEKAERDRVLAVLSESGHRHPSFSYGQTDYFR